MKVHNHLLLNELQFRDQLSEVTVLKITKNAIKVKYITDYHMVEKTEWLSKSKVEKYLVENLGAPQKTSTLLQRIKRYLS